MEEKIDQTIATFINKPEDTSKISVEALPDHPAFYTNMENLFYNS